jgi:V/A-type H+-transporting ATPase subunit A
MPVAAREASVYTAVTIAEYYRQMGLDVLLLADSTSRWAQAMREMSGRLEEIPGEEAFPAYLESVIASFYERAGAVRLKDGTRGSVTVGGTVSPAGGNFEEPVTQATLKVVGAFHGLSRDRAEARKYPAIHPLESWSKYPITVLPDKVEVARQVLMHGDEVGQMMKVVGEEGTSLGDYVTFLKSEFLDSVYLQQDSFNAVDAAVSSERQNHDFGLICEVLESEFDFNDKDEARSWFYQLRQKFLDHNVAEWQSDAFKGLEAELRTMFEDKKTEKVAVGAATADGTGTDSGNGSNAD